VAALLLRLLVFAVVLQKPEKMFRPDSPSYYSTALNLVDGYGYSSSSSAPYTPNIMRTPTYPFFLAFLFEIFGKNFHVVAFAQIILSVMTIVLAYYAVLRFGTQKQAFLGALLLTCSTGSVIFSNYILTETLFSWLLMIITWLLIKYHENQEGKVAVLMGILCGVLILCRPVAILFPLVVVVLYSLINQFSWRPILIHSFLFLFATVITISPWIIRNKKEANVYTISSIANFNLLYFNAVSLRAYMEGKRQDTVRNAIKEEVESELERRNLASNQKERLAYYNTKAREIILPNISTYLYIHFLQSLNTFLPHINDALELFDLTQGQRGTLSVLNQKGIFAAVDYYLGGRYWLLLLMLPILVLLGLTYLCAAAGALVLFHKKERMILTILVFVMLYFLLMTGPASIARFRLPVMTNLCILAGIGLCEIIILWKHTRKINP